MGWMDAPKAPDPLKTAQTQSQLNMDTAIGQQQLNFVDQDTPYGSVKYVDNGYSFNPSDTGQDWYFNSKTGEYRKDAPIAGYNETVTPGTTTTGGHYTHDGNYVGGTTTGSGTTTRDPIYEEGWDKQKGVLVPKTKAVTTLTAEQQKILDQTNAANLNIASIANDRSGFLKDYLGKPLDLSGAPALRTSIGDGYSGDIGNGYNTKFSGDIGGNYSNTVGGGYNSNYNSQIGGSYSDRIAPGYRTDVNLQDSYAGADDFSADRQRVEEALNARQAPALAQNRERLETQLVNRGLRPGTAAWNSELNRLGQEETDSRMASIVAGGQEQSRMVGMARDAAQFSNDANLNEANFGNTARTNQFQLQNNAAKDAALFGQNAQTLQNKAVLDRSMFQNEASYQQYLARMGAQEATNSAAMGAAGFRNDAALTGANFNNSARSQYLNEAYAERAQPLNEITGLLGTTQIQNPNFVSTPTTSVAGVDYTSGVNNRYQQQMQQRSSAMGGLFGLAGAGLSLFGGPLTGMLGGAAAGGMGAGGY